MSSSISRFLVLAFARVANYAILLVSPIVFVRILDQHAYGQYREFVVYALALATVLGFSVKTSILYFIPKDPDNERKYVTQTALFIFASSALGLGITYAARHIVFARASFDFAEPLLLYVFFFLNLDFVESYWLAKKRSDYVLYYSTAKSAIKITVSMAVGYVTRSVEAIVTALVIFEACKFLALLCWFSSRRLFTVTLDTALIREHLRLVLPFGAGTVVYGLNQQLGKLFTSMTLGPSALAVYTIGAYQIPITGLVRSAAGDVLFPEMVQRGQGSPMAGLSLWNRANVLYCFVVFPFFTVLFFLCRYVRHDAVHGSVRHRRSDIPRLSLDHAAPMLRDVHPPTGDEREPVFHDRQPGGDPRERRIHFCHVRGPWPPGGTDRVIGLRGGVGGLSGEPYTQGVFHPRAADVILEQTHGDRAGRSAERAHIADRGIGSHRGRRSSHSIFFTFPGGLFRIRAPLSAR